MPKKWERFRRRFRTIIKSMGRSAEERHLEDLRIGVEREAERLRDLRGFDSEKFSKWRIDEGMKLIEEYRRKLTDVAEFHSMWDNERHVYQKILIDYARLLEEFGFVLHFEKEKFYQRTTKSRFGIKRKIKGEHGRMYFKYLRPNPLTPEVLSAVKEILLKGMRKLDEGEHTHEILSAIRLEAAEAKKAGNKERENQLNELYFEIKDRPRPWFRALEELYDSLNK